MYDPETVRLAARNNAEWCDIVCRTHGIAGTFHTDVWTSAHRTPPYYPDAVTLDDPVSPERILGHVDTVTPGCSIKDSFARVDLSAAGFRILFDAEWIYRPANAELSTNESGTRWERIDDAGLLPLWDAAWAGDGSPTGLFRPALLDHEAVMVLGARVGDRIVAGAILNRSASVVGVSNLFTTLENLHRAWAECLTAIADYVPGVLVVGYEDGAALTAAHDLGFTSVGPLRIWLAS